MNHSGQRQLVLVGSLALTALLLGGLVGGLAIWRTVGSQLQDPDFLAKQLEAINAQSDKPAAAPAAALVRVSLAESKPIQPMRPIVGRLVEVRRVTISSEVLGKVVELAVEEGTAVTEGKTVLARIDDFWPRVALARSRAQVAWTEAQLNYELAELQRYERLREGNATTESEVEAKQASVDELKARLNEAEAMVEEESERLVRSVIYAPFDGTVVAKHAELGEHVSPGTPIVDVVSRGEVDARLMVPESIVNFIHIGDTLPIHVDPLGEDVPGKVHSITPYGASASRTFPVRVRLDDQGGRLKVGMSVTAQIGMGPRREALVVSKDAVLVRPDGSTVWVALPGAAGDQFQAQPVPVTIGPRTAAEYAVEPETSEGRKLLVAGARVVIEGAERLTPGQQVRIVTLDPPPAQPASPAEPKTAAAADTASRLADGQRPSRASENTPAP